MPSLRKSYVPWGDRVKIKGTDLSHLVASLQHVAPLEHGYHLEQLGGTFGETLGGFQKHCQTQNGTEVWVLPRKFNLLGHITRF